MKRVVFVSLAAFLAVSLSAQTTDTKKDSEVELNQYGQQVNSTPGQVKIQDGIMVLDAKKIDYKIVVRHPCAGRRRCLFRRSGLHFFPT